jgi:acylphosphatase
MKTVHVLIKGKVQGVFYRATAKKVAQQLHLTGWVKNTREGAVEATASGTEQSITEFIAWCERGPSSAMVTSVEVSLLDYKNFDDFSIKRD